MRRALAIILSAPGIGLSACGDHLGDYRADDVRLVRQIPPHLGVTGIPPPYPQYVRIELSSQANLNVAKTGAGLYTEADFCPLRDGNRMIAFGPAASDGKAVESWLRTGGLAPDRRDGRFHYFVYVVPSSPPRRPYSNSKDVYPRYDLRESDRDLCLQFFVPGYNIIGSRSGTVRIAAGSIRSALE